jgi:methionyl-tRNA formyltransferase
MKELKIVCLVKNHPHTVYFVNRITQVHPVSLVLVESEPVIAVSFLIKARTLLRNYFTYFVGRKKPKVKSISFDEVFSDMGKQFDPKLKIKYVQNINSSEVLKILKANKFDLLLDHGTSLLSSEIIGSAKLALNLHWGLSPYYRGTHCTDWALINWDPYNIGVTIHKLAKKIDGGDILAQERVEPTDVTRAKAINLLLTKVGTELIIKIAGRLKQGKQLKFFKQDFSRGYMTTTRQWNSYLQQQLEYIETPEVFEKMLAKPARRIRLPIIKI